MSKIKKADLLQLIKEQAEMMVKLTGMVEMNKLSIIKLENEGEQRFEALEEFASYADNMLTELNHALPDPEYDAKCEAAANIEASLDRHRERLGLNEPQLKQLDQSVFDGLDKKWRFAAVDADGKAHRCNLHVKPHHERGEFWRGCTFPPLEFELIGEGYDATNWQDSLIERESKELTGSDYYHSGIALKLLERGQKLVVCFVSNVSEADALNEKTIEVITSLDTEFNDADDYGWQFVVPINNQGEPLTQSDVGL